MGMTYFKRYRMEFDLRNLRMDEPVIPPDYELIPYAGDQIREHAVAKFNSFRFELDADVFPCLARRDGCLKLMRDITARQDFVPAATWLIRHLEQDPTTGSICKLPVGTIQGLSSDGWGAIQNLGVSPLHRGKGLGTILLAKAAAGFASVGLEKMHLEVTTENTGAVRLYERMGFKKSRIVYKAAEVAGARS
ncbi:GNAT family N-acetyltransferase [Stieleria sp. JC731]|nr:GNAT family N-acetyltransferase [Stieleria sp. JC731]